MTTDTTQYATQMVNASIGLLYVILILIVVGIPFLAYEMRKRK